RDSAGRVMITACENDGDSKLIQAGHLSDEIKTCAGVAPIAVIEIARKKHECNMLGDGKIDELRERSSRCPPDSVDRGAFVRIEAEQRAVEMDVSRVDESHYSAAQGSYVPKLHTCPSRSRHVNPRPP